MIDLPTNLTVILATITVVAILLYLKEYFLRKKTLTNLKNFNLETKQKSIQLLTAAQLAETQVLAEGDYATRKLISEFKLKLQDLIKLSEKSITASQDSLIKFMADLQKRGVEFEVSSRAATEQRINQVFEHLENKLSDFLIQTEQKTTTSIELELKAVRQLIDTYKNQQLKLIDENIVAMMEQTLNLVLSKKMSLKDQLDLIYEALDKAKMEKFIV